MYAFLQFALWYLIHIKLNVFIVGSHERIPLEKTMNARGETNMPFMTAMTHATQTEAT